MKHPVAESTPVWSGTCSNSVSALMRPPSPSTFIFYTFYSALLPWNTHTHIYLVRSHSEADSSARGGGRRGAHTVTARPLNTTRSNLPLQQSSACWARRSEPVAVSLCVCVCQCVRPGTPRRGGELIPQHSTQSSMALCNGDSKVSSSGECPIPGSPGWLGVRTPTVRCTHSPG